MYWHIRFVGVLFIKEMYISAMLENIFILKNKVELS